MSDIKFRAYIKIEEWQGYYYPNDKNDYIQFIIFQDSFGIVDCNDDWLKDNEFIIEQFIGLQDKNKKDIYEGDKLQNQSHTFTVYWDKLSASFKMKDENGGIYIFNSFIDTLEIVGHIHE
jgi:hypothetical protein